MSNEDKLALPEERLIADMNIAAGWVAPGETTEDVVLKLRMGRQAGLKDQVALQHIYIIPNKKKGTKSIGLDGQAMLALIKSSRAYGGSEYQWLDKEGQWHKGDEDPMPDRLQFAGWATKMWRRGAQDVYMATFTLADAKRLGLSEKWAWQQWFVELCKWRTVADCGRTVFADLLAGLTYVPEELGAKVEVDNEGQVHVVGFEVEDSEEQAAEPEAAEEQTEWTAAGEICDELSRQNELMSNIHMAAVAANISVAKCDSDIKQRVNAGGDVGEALLELLDIYESVAKELAEVKPEKGEVKRLDEPEQGALIDG